MKKPPRLLVLAVLVPFLHGCFGVVAEPVSQGVGRPPEEDVRGVVLQGPGEGTRVEYDEVVDVDWTDSTVVVTGTPKSSPDGTGGGRSSETRSFALSEVRSLLVHRFDADRTSVLVAGLIIGTIGAIALAVTGSGDRSGEGMPPGE